MHIKLTVPTVCADGDVRLANGTDRSGRVEVCLNNSYWAVCDNGWGVINAGVVCSQLQFNFSSEYFLVHMWFCSDWTTVLSP